MRSQQQAERAEQQRIKNLVLNYDLNDDQHDGEEPAFHYVHASNRHHSVLVGKGNLNRSLRPPSYRDGRTQRSASSGEIRDRNSTIPATHPQQAPSDSFTDQTGPIDHPYSQPRQDKSGNTRSKQRARKLQMGDMDWYGDRFRAAATSVMLPSERRNKANLAAMQDVTGYERLHEYDHKEPRS